MLFNSGIFLFGFLPVALFGFFALGMLGRRLAAILWLSLASLVFYAWWNIANLPLLLLSIACNFALGRALSRNRSKPLLIVGIVLNVAALTYFKFAGFLVQTIDLAAGLNVPIPHIVLPLAISFFTFQQIAYLCDAYDGLAEDSGFSRYLAFITFFPHLIAGPITHHREIIPQFSQTSIFRPQPQMLAIGLTMFLMGLFKKVMIADVIASYANPVFDAGVRGEPLTLLEAWGGALSYTLQIYFDFSGYSDMAIGLGLLFGIRLPFNFDSPLKAASIIDFWSRWHMTLTRFVTAYLYNPVALRLSRRRMQAGKPMPKRGRMTAGAFVVLVAWPTLLAFLVIGVWHGAGWQFAVFGLLHALYLIVNHAWRTLKKTAGWQQDDANPLFLVASVLLTLGCVVVGLVFFRSSDVATALHMLNAMSGANGLGLRSTQLLSHRQIELIAFLFLLVWFLPNTQEWLRRFPTGLGEIRAPGWLERKLLPLATLTVWRPSPVVAAMVGLIGFLAIAKAISAAAPEFIYFNF